MKIRDLVKLGMTEYHYGRKECLLACLLQSVILALVIFTITVFWECGDCGEQVLVSIQGEAGAYVFTLRGYTEDDIPLLTKRGFYNLSLEEKDSTSSCGSRKVLAATVDSLRYVWIYKILDRHLGKDIWNDDLDLFMGITLFSRVVFLMIGVVLCLVMVSSLRNTYSMKLDERKYYRMMLEQLGCEKKNVNLIFRIYFGVRGNVSLLLAVTINALSIAIVNSKIEERMNVDFRFSGFQPAIVGIAILTEALVSLIAFRKVRGDQR